jgi:hypothetical protein
MFEECSLRWWLRYVCKIRKGQTIQMMTGDGVHQMLAENFKQKAVTGLDLTFHELSDKFSTFFDLKVMEGVDIPDGKIPGQYKDGGLAVLRNYLREMAPPMIPRMVKLDGVFKPAVELEFRKPIPYTNYDMLGYIDIWLYEGPVVDYKVVARKWGAKEIPHKSRQALAYDFLIGHAEPFQFHVCVRDAVKPVVQAVDANFTDADVEGYVRRLWGVLNEMEQVRSGDLEPRTSTSYCSKLMCQHYDECRAWKLGIFDPDDIEEEQMPAGELEEEIE